MGNIPKGSVLHCTITFLEGEVAYKTDKKSVLREYKYSGHINELEQAKQDAYSYFLKYVKDFDLKYPDGYIMLHKVEWETDQSSKKVTTPFIKNLCVPGVSEDF